MAKLAFSSSASDRSIDDELMLPLRHHWPSNISAILTSHENQEFGSRCLLSFSSFFPALRRKELLS
jgi:hypothetical protein